MAELRFGVIGLGFMGGRWARGSPSTPVRGWRWSATCRGGRPSGGGALRRCRFLDPFEVVADRDLGAIAVCTPEHAHTAVALAAIDAGKAVMVEKPLAHTVAEAEQIRDRAALRGVPVLTGHTLQFDPGMPPCAGRSNPERSGRCRQRSERIGLVSDQQVLGGRTSIALYYGVHEFDLCRWYAGEVEAVWATRAAGSWPRTATRSRTSTPSACGSPPAPTARRWSAGPSARHPGFGVGGFTVIGEHGLLRVAQGDAGLLAVGRDGPADVDVYYSPEVDGRLYGAFGIEVDHFVRVAGGQVEPCCTAADGAAAVRIALAMEDAAASGEVVRP